MRWKRAPEIAVSVRTTVKCILASWRVEVKLAPSIWASRIVAIPAGCKPVASDHEKSIRRVPVKGHSRTPDYHLSNLSRSQTYPFCLSNFTSRNLSSRKTNRFFRIYYNSKYGKKPKYLSKDDWLNKLGYMHITQ